MLSLRLDQDVFATSCLHACADLCPPRSTLKLRALLLLLDLSAKVIGSIMRGLMHCAEVLPLAVCLTAVLPMLTLLSWALRQEADLDGLVSLLLQLEELLLLVDADSRVV